MKTLIALLLLLCSLPSLASWRIVEVLHPETAQSTGFIYHVYATGNATTGTEVIKAVGGLRFVCSSSGSDNPVILLYWQDMKGAGTRQVTVKNGTKTEVYAWEQENNIMFRPMKDSKRLLQTIRTSTVLQFSWNYSGTDYSVVFDMTDFNKQYTQFRTKCKIPE